MKLRKFRILFKTAVFVGLFVFIVSFVSGYFSERVKMYVAQKAQLVASDLMSETIKTDVLPYINLDNLIKFVTDDENNVKSIFVNTYQVNQIAAQVSGRLAALLRSFEGSELKSLELPLGIILSDTLFGSRGPAIAIRIFPVGSVVVDVVSTCENHGINNTLLTVAVTARVVFTAIIPLQKNEVEVDVWIPLVVHIVQGEVPRYYYANKDSEFIPHPIIE